MGAPRSVATVGTGTADPADAVDPAGWVHHLLDLARTRLGMEVAWLTVFADERQEVTAAAGDLEAMGVTEGIRCRWPGPSACGCRPGCCPRW